MVGKTMNSGENAPITPEHIIHHPPEAHRWRVDNRAAMNAIFFVLRTGCH